MNQRSVDVALGLEVRLCEFDARKGKEQTLVLGKGAVSSATLTRRDARR